MNRKHAASQAEATPESPWKTAVEYGSLHVGFLMTGAYTTLLGTALPLLAARWHLHDSRSGALFVAQFLGSMAGALLRGRDLVLMIAAGFAVIALSCATLASVPAAIACAVLFTYGLGLGTAMTSTSVWLTNRSTTRHGSALASLNAVWAAGAGIAPWLLLPFARSGTLPHLLRWFALPAAGFAVFTMLWRLRLLQGTPNILLPSTAKPSTLVPLSAKHYRVAILLGLLSFGSVGAESSLGGWLTTYVTRMSGTALVTSGAASGFWFGLLGSRILASLLLLTRVSALTLLFASLAVAAVGASLLLGAHTPVLLVSLAALCGAGIGPLYPLVLSYALRMFTGRWIFALAGLGAAATPWATGLLSQRAGSIRAGMLLSVGMLLVMLVALLAGWRSLSPAAAPSNLGPAPHW